MSLEFKRGDDTWKRLRKRGARDLFWFNDVVLGTGELFPFEESTHLVAMQFVSRTTGVPDIDEAPIQLCMWPRECGKSTSVTEAYAIQRACNDPDIAILIANEVADNAASFVQTIQKHFENNEMLRALYPEVIPENFNRVTWSGSQAELQRTTRRPEPTFDSVGVGGTKVGSHFDLVILDDLIAEKAYENARIGNWSIIEHANRWTDKLDAMLSKSAKPFPQLLFIGTHWYPGDTYTYIEKSFGYREQPRRYRITVTGSNGMRYSHEVMRVGDIAIFKIGGYKEGRPAFPHIWPQERMEKALMRDPEWFSCNVLNDPTTASVRTFQDEWLHYWKFVDSGNLIAYRGDEGQTTFVKVSNLYKLITVDPAFSTGEDSSRSAVVVLGVDMDTGKMLVLDALAQKADPKDVAVDIVNAADRWGVTKVWVELAGQQLSYLQWIEREAASRDQPLVVDKLKPGGRNKDLRIETLVVPFKNGDLLLHPSQNALINEEYKHYRPGAKQRDVLDALAYAVEIAPKPRAGRGMNAKQRSEKELESFRQRYQSRFGRSKVGV